MAKFGLWSLVNRQQRAEDVKAIYIFLASPAPMANPPEPAASPRCIACGETMRLITVQPAYFYRDLDEHAYSCGCGASATIFVRRRKRA